MATHVSGHKTSNFNHLPNIAEKRGLFIGLGILLLLAGGFAIYSAVYTTLLTIALLGGIVRAGSSSWLMPH
jgi:uncharacterized membrane protein HdeD (DUF308 family)